MNSSAPLPLELRLSAYVDGNAADHDLPELEGILVNDPQARSLHDALERGRDAGRQAFEDMLKEPVPLDLVRFIKNTPLPRRAIRAPSAGGTFGFKRSAARFVALSVFIFLGGGGLGYMIGARPTMSQPSQLSGSVAETRDFFDDVIAQYRLFARQSKHLVEITADKPADILEWLTTNTGVSFQIPDLAGNGLTFEGARLFAAAGAPVGQLLYRRTDGGADGDMIAISFTKARPDRSRSVEEIRNDTSVVTWGTPLADYMVVGPSAAADLDDIAAKAAGLI